MASAFAGWDRGHKTHFGAWARSLLAAAAAAVLVLAACVFTETDERFEVTVRASRSGSHLHRMRKPRYYGDVYIPATDTRSVLRVVQPRRGGIEYRADHADGPDGGELYLVTNDGATEFRLVRTPVAAPGADGVGLGRGLS